MKMNAKRFLSVVLCVVLLITLMPISAWAATVQVDNPDDFKLALDNAADGDVIKLTGDITYAVDITSPAISIRGKTITFDVGAFTLNVVNTSGQGLDVGAGGVVNLEKTTGAFNVTSQSNHSDCVYAHDGGKATVTNAISTGIGSSGAGAIGTGSKITVTGAAQGSYSGVAANNGGTVTVGSAAHPGSVTTTSWGCPGAEAIGGTITVFGDAQGVLAGAYASNGGTITVYGDAQGVYHGVIANDNSIITVTGKVTATDENGIYMQIDFEDKAPGDGLPGTGSDAGYLVYIGQYSGGSKVRVKDSSDAALLSLTVAGETLHEPFSSDTYAYTASVAYDVSSVTVTPTARHAGATIKVNGTAVESGKASAPIPLSVGANTVTIVVTAPDGTAMQTYILTVTREAGPYDYLDETGVLRSTGSATVTPINSGTATLTSGWYVVEGTVNRSGTITVTGGVHLILADGANLTVTGSLTDAGINVSGENSLTIYAQSTGAAMGVLTVTAIHSGIGGAGIGGGIGGNGGTITINGGAITANGGGEGAGIGGGGFGDNGGTIAINGGAVTANGGVEGAGIGGGIYGDGGTIAINGGTVTANGGDNSAGIGAGYEGNGGTITIRGGTVKANGGIGGAGIGGGNNGSFPGGGGGEISIEGGVVFARGGTSVSDIGPGPYGQDGTLGISGTAAVFLRNDSYTTPNTTTHQHYLFTDHTAGDSVYDIPVPWDGSFGAYLPVAFSDAALSGLILSSGTLDPDFSSGTYAYAASVAQSVESVTVMPTANDANVTIEVNGAAVSSGTASDGIALSVGSNTITIVVTAQDGATTQTYTVTVTREGDLGPSTYTVTLNQATGGTATASHTSATAGTPVTLGISSLGANYSFVRWDVSPSVTWTSGSATEASAAFAMPDGNVTVTPVYQYNGGTTYADAFISPSKVTFDKATGQDVSVTLNSGSYTLQDLKNGTYTLKKGTDYTVSGCTVAIKATYLNFLATGKQTITFDMSGGADPILTITIADKANPDTGAHIPFEDVTVDDWFVSNVMWAFDSGLMKGVSEKPMLFAPHGTTTRGMIVTILHRLESTPPGGTTNIFVDVAEGKWYTDAVVWAHETGIVKGYDAETFGPEDPITREQMAVILYRYAGYKGYDISVGEETNILSYDDAFDISEYAIPAIQWACGAGIMQGEGAKLDPQGNATRAQVAAMLMRFVAYRG